MPAHQDFSPQGLCNGIECAPDCQFRRLADARPDYKKFWNSNQARLINRGGVGTELRTILNDIGIPACQQCHDRAAEMDRMGLAWCKDNRATIIGWLSESSARLGWFTLFKSTVTAIATGVAFSLSVTDPIGSIVDEAIKRYAASPAARRQYIAHGEGNAGLGDALLGLCAVQGYCAANEDKPVTYGAAQHTIPFTSMFEHPSTLEFGYGVAAIGARGDMMFGEHFDPRCRTDKSWTRLNAYCEKLGGSYPVLPKLRDRDVIKDAMKEYKDFIVLAPCVAKSGVYGSREYPRHAWLALADKLRAIGRRVIIADDTHNRLSIFLGHNIAIGPQGGWSPDRLCGLMLNAACLVGNDSGLAHLSGILGVPTVVLCGSTIGDQVFDFYPRVECIQGNLPCSGCWWGGVYRSELCDHNCASLASIQTDTIINAIHRAEKRPSAKVRIVTNSSPDYRTLSDVTWLSKKRYAITHDLDWYHLVQRNDLTWRVWLDQLKMTQEGNWLWGLDSDAAITGNSDIRELLDDGTDIVISADANGLNCGSMLLRNTKQTLSLIERAIAIRNQQWQEQGAISHLLSGHKRYEDFTAEVGPLRCGGYPASERLLSTLNTVLNRTSVRVKVVRQRLMNAYPSVQYGFTGTEEWSWHPGDLVCHLPGKPLSERINFFRSIL